MSAATRGPISEGASGTVDWQRLRRVFVEASEAPATEREACLRRACGNDETLRREARALLDAHDDAHAFLERPVADLVGGDDPSDVSTAGRVARRVGPYALIRCLGHGGMGTVFEAVRADDEYDDRVAIKVIRTDLVTDELVARFRSERQLLADLRHPHIAQLLDGGTDGAGRPYLVMELVEGVPIDSYCDQQGLCVDQRVRLFIDVCRAVHVAHQSLVVHRDLKPANLLVTADGRAKLLDFGIAKLLSPASDAATLTRGAAPMTLDYASPEQLAGGPITTASDVYALGVMLFELLAGHRPRSLAGCPPGDVALAIEREAPRMSAAFGRSAASERAVVAARRATSAARLGRALGGDLDTIVAQALVTDPRRRYASAEDLAQDLERCLAGQPVRARAGGIAYRCGRLIARNRYATAAGVAAFAASVGFVAMLLGQHRQVLLQQARSAATAGFLIDLFDVSNPDAFHADRSLVRLFPEHQRGQDVTARDLLDIGARRVQERLAEAPDIRADVMSTIGWAYHRLGAWQAARKQLTLALEAARDADGPHALGIARISVRLAGVRREQAAFDHAEALLIEARGIAEGFQSREASEIRHQIDLERARVDLARGRLDAAAEGLAKALRQRDAQAPSDDPLRAATLATLGDVARERGDALAAEAHYRSALTIDRAHYGPRHPRIAALLHDLALLHKQAGDYASAEEALREAHGMHVALYGERHPAIAMSLHGLADLLRKEGRFEQAEGLAQEALVLRRSLYGDNHPMIGLGLNLLGLIRSARGAFAEAEANHRQALGHWAGTVDDDHVWIASAHNNLAAALAGQSRFEEAAEHYLEALARYRSHYRAPHAQVARVLINLGVLRRRQGSLDQAEARYREAVAIQRAVLPHDHPDLLSLLHNLAAVALRRGRPAEAESLVREAVERYRTRVGPDSAMIGAFRITLARALRDLGRRDQARVELQGALDTFSGHLDHDHPWPTTARRDLEALDAAQ